jgi:hypothetical protein
MFYTRAVSNPSVAILALLTFTLVKSPAFAASFPLLSGTYVYTVDKFCQLSVTNDYKTLPLSSGGSIEYLATVAQTGGSSNEIGLSAGTVVFTQGTGTPGKGSLSTTGLTADGTAIVIHNAGDQTGTIGAPLAFSSGAGTSTFSQTASTFTVADSSDPATTFAIYYGKSLSGIAQHAVAFGNNGKGCAQRFTFTRN